MLGAAVPNARATVIVSRSSDDTWIQLSAPDTNFDPSVNPSTQLRDADPNIIRASFYKFPLPQLPAGEAVSSVDLRLVVNSGGTQYWNVAIGKLKGSTPNPDLSTMTWNTAVADGYMGGTIPGNGFHHAFGPNSTGTNLPLTGDWVVNQNFADAGIAVYTDNTPIDGLAKDVSDSISSAGSVDITLMLNPRGDNQDRNNAIFYGEGNGEGPNPSNPPLASLYANPSGSGSFDFYPRPYLIITTAAVPEPGALGVIALVAVAGFSRRRARVKG
jgi:hypothetical protein